MTLTAQKKRNVLIDTNLAILLIVGRLGRENIAKHKRLSNFDASDFDILTKLLTQADILVYSPYVLSETSNLLRQSGNKSLDYPLTEIFRQSVREAREIQLDATKIVADPSFPKLGMTDAGLLTILETHDDLLLMSADFDLCITAQSRGFSVINFNNARDH